MNDLTRAVAVLGKPYAITRTRLGAITKIFQDQYICDVPSLKELFQSIGEKLGGIAHTQTPTFSFLISFSDQTHHDGVTADLLALTSIPIGKQTERVVVKWTLVHKIEEADNELSVTIRISNPVNPLIFLQAALSKSPSDLDNAEFEMGSTCVTVDGAVQSFADEVFLRVQKWIEARNKPHTFLPVHKVYAKYEWLLDQLTASLLPLLTVSYLSLAVAQEGDASLQLTMAPIIIALFFVVQALGRRLNNKMARWARNSGHISLFQLTHGDGDALTKRAAKANNSALKLIASTILAFAINILAGLACWWITKA